MKIAIDGPAGAGKSTIAKKIAQETGFIYIDTGAMYRALTWKALKNGIDLDDTKALRELALKVNIHFHNNSIQQIFCDDQNVTEDIRLPEVTNSVSRVAAHPVVREVMVKKQQEMANTVSIVMDGRDIGECVLPDADYKFFITAGIEERANRRAKEMKQKGLTSDWESVKEEIAARDKMDMEREVGALKILEDSIIIDTSDFSIEQVLTKILSIIREE